MIRLIGYSARPATAELPALPAAISVILHSPFRASEFEDDACSKLVAVRVRFSTRRRRGGQAVVEPLYVEAVRAIVVHQRWDDHHILHSSLFGSDDVGLLRLALTRKEVSTPMWVEVVSALDPCADLFAIAELIERAELLTDRLAGVDVSFERSGARCQSAAELCSPTGQRIIRGLRADAGEVFLVDVADEIGAPGIRALLAAEIDTPFHLRQRRRRTRGCGGRRIRAGRVPDVAEHGEGDFRRRVHVVVDEDSGETPTDIACSAIAQRKCDVRVRAGNHSKQRRPGLADADRRRAANEIDVRETETRNRLRVAESARSVEPAEEIAFDR